MRKTTKRFINIRKKKILQARNQKKPEPKGTPSQTVVNKPTLKNTTALSTSQKEEDEKEDEKEMMMAQEEQRIVPLTVASSNTQNTKVCNLDVKDGARTVLQHHLQEIERTICTQVLHSTININVKDKQINKVRILEEKIVTLESKLSEKECFIQNLQEQNKALEEQICNLNAQFEKKPKTIKTISTQVTEQSFALPQIEVVSSPILTSATAESSTMSTSSQHTINTAITTRKPSQRKKKQDDIVPNLITRYFKEKSSSTNCSGMQKTKFVPVTPDGASSSSKKCDSANKISKMKLIDNSDMVLIDLTNETNDDNIDKDDNSSIEVIKRELPSSPNQQSSSSMPLLDRPIPKRQKISKEVILTKEENNEPLRQESYPICSKDELNKLCHVIDQISNKDVEILSNEITRDVVPLPTNFTNVISTKILKSANEKDSVITTTNATIKEVNFLKHVRCAKQSKVFRVRMFTNDAICPEDPRGILPSIWGLENGYIACEARILPPEIKTSMEAKKFMLETFPINNLTTSTIVRKKLRNLFEDSPSWSDVEWQKSGLQYCTGYMHFAHNLQEGDVVVLIVRGTKKNIKKKKEKSQKVYFGLIKDSELIVETTENLQGFPTQHLWKKPIFRCGRILLRRVKWCRMANVCDLPHQSETKHGVKHVPWLLQYGPSHWIGDCTPKKALIYMQSVAFKNKTELFDINKI